MKEERKKKKESRKHVQTYVKLLQQLYFNVYMFIISKCMEGKHNIFH